MIVFPILLSLLVKLIIWGLNYSEDLTLALVYIECRSAWHNKVNFQPTYCLNLKFSSIEDEMMDATLNRSLIRVDECSLSLLTRLKVYCMRLIIIIQASRQKEKENFCCIPYLFTALKKILTETIIMGMKNQYQQMNNQNSCINYELTSNLIKFA